MTWRIFPAALAACFFALSCAANAQPTAKTKTVGDSVYEIQNGLAGVHAKRTRSFTTDHRSHDGLTTIFSNLGTIYPDGTYYPDWGWAVDGPGGVPGFFPQLWQAFAFTPASDTKLKEVDLALGYFFNGKNEAVVALYDDNSDQPGTLIKKFTVENLPDAGSCCVLSVVKIPKGIPLAAGKQYWLAVENAENNPNLSAGWMTNTTEQITPFHSVQWCSDDVAHTGTCGDQNDKWTIANPLPGSAFALYGK